MPITGQRGGFLQPGKWGRNDSGNYDTWTFEATNKADIYAMAARIAQTLGLAYDVTESFGKFKLDVYFPWNTRGIDPRTDLIEKWELFAQPVDKDLLAARIENVNSIAQLSPAQVATIRFYLQNPPSGAPNAENPYPTADDFETDGETNGALALQVLILMMQGVSSFPVEAPQLRRTETTSSQYAVISSLTSVGKIITTGSLQSIENAPQLFYNLPEDTWVEPNPNFTSIGFAFGWRKRYPTIQQVALLKWNIVQEWDYGYWATLLYGSPL